MRAEALGLAIFRKVFGVAACKEINKKFVTKNNVCLGSVQKVPIPNSLQMPVVINKYPFSLSH